MNRQKCSRLVSLIVLAVVAITSTLYGQNGDQGGAYVYWKPVSLTPGYDIYEWTITVQELPNVQSYYFWAINNGFLGGDTFSGGASCPKGSCANGFYMGLQPYGSPVLACPDGGSNCKIALFSFFGKRRFVDLAELALPVLILVPERAAA